jgi:hybrid cluster-associated redox disulfide protein
MGKKIKKDMTFEELIKENPEAAAILLGEGMHCAGCPFAARETIEQGASVHGVDVDKLIKKIEKKKK